MCLTNICASLVSRHFLGPEDTARAKENLRSLCSGGSDDKQVVTCVFCAVANNQCCERNEAEEAREGVMAGS